MVKTIYWVLAALILAFAGGWFVHAHYSASRYNSAVAHADSLQVVADSSDARLGRLRDSVLVHDSLAHIQDSLNHATIISIAKRELEIVDSIRKVPNIPPAVLVLIDSLVVTHEQERTIWDNEVTLLKGQFAEEHRLRTQTDSVLLDTQKENTALRIAVNQKPTQIVVGNSILKDALIASLAVNAFQFALHH